jgi:hypothetical protein
MEPSDVTIPATSSRSFTPERHAFERAGVAAPDARVGRSGLGQQRIAVPTRDHGVQVGMRRIDAIEDGLHHFQGGRPPRPKGVAELYQRGAQEFDAHARPPSPAPSRE